MTQMQTVAELFRCSHHRKKYPRAWAAIILCSNTLVVGFAGPRKPLTCKNVGNKIIAAEGHSWSSCFFPYPMVPRSDYITVQLG